MDVTGGRMSELELLDHGRVVIRYGDNTIKEGTIGKCTFAFRLEHDIVIGTKLLWGGGSEFRFHFVPWTPFTGFTSLHI